MLGDEKVSPIGGRVLTEDCYALEDCYGTRISIGVMTCSPIVGTT